MPSVATWRRFCGGLWLVGPLIFDQVQAGRTKLTGGWLLAQKFAAFQQQSELGFLLPSGPDFVRLAVYTLAGRAVCGKVFLRLVRHS